MFERYLYYGEIITCPTPERLGQLLEQVLYGFSGVPSASVLFNHALNQKEAIDWIIQRAEELQSGEILFKAKTEREILVQRLTTLLK